MSSATVRISLVTREKLRALADQSGESMNAVLEQAVEIYRRIVDDFPNYEPAQVNLIIALIRAGDRVGAVQQTRAAVERMPDNHRIKYLARLLAEPANKASSEKSRLSFHEDP